MTHADEKIYRENATSLLFLLFEKLSH